MKADEATIREIRERGFAIVRGVLESSEIGPLTALLEQCIQEDLDRFGPDYIDRWMVQNLMTRGLPFAKLLESEKIHAYLSEFLNDTCIVYAYTSSSMPPGSSNYSNRIHVDCPRWIPGYITNVGVLIALTDFTIENGAPGFLPGSCLQPEAPTEAEFEDRAERVVPKAGDAVIFNARTFHRGYPNLKESPRHAITMNVCRSYMRQRFDYPRVVPRHLVDALGPVGKRFLGFDVRMPVSLEEYYLPEDRRLYKPNQG